MMPNIKISLLAVSLLVTSCGSTSYQEPSGEYRWVENPNMTVKDFNSSNLSCQNQRLAISLPACTMPYAYSENVWLRNIKDCDAKNAASRDRNNVYKNCMQLSGYNLKWFEYWELEDLNSDESTQSIEVSADERHAARRQLIGRRKGEQVVELRRVATFLMRDEHSKRRAGGHVAKVDAPRRRIRRILWVFPCRLGLKRERGRIVGDADGILTARMLKIDQPQAHIA